MLQARRRWFATTKKASRRELFDDLQLQEVLDRKSSLLHMSERVPLAMVECWGTTVRKVFSPTLLSSATWLPFWRRTSKPARFNARTSRSPETLGSLVMSVGYFDKRPESLLRSYWQVGNSPGFNVKFDRFAKI
jgi:hypothetical protein